MNPSAPVPPAGTPPAGTVLQPGGTVAPVTPPSSPVAPVTAPQGTPAAPLTPQQLAGTTVPSGPQITATPPAGPVVQPVTPPAGTPPAGGGQAALVVPPGTDPELAKALGGLGMDPQKIADYFLSRDAQYKQELDTGWAKQRSDWARELSTHAEYGRNPAETTEAENRAVQKLPAVAALHAAMVKLGYELMPEYRLALRDLGLRIPADKVGGANAAPSMSPTGPEKDQAAKNAAFFSHPESRRAHEEAQRRRQQR